MPTTANAPAPDVIWGNANRRVEPVRAPTAAPMKSVGVKTPPTAPEPTVDAVLATLASSTANNSQPTRRLCRMASTTLYPLPHTWGNTIEMRPTISPPNANFKYKGPGSDANRLLLHANNARNGGAK